MAGMKTITGKNQKARLIKTAHNMTVYSLDNYFNEKPIPQERVKDILEKNINYYKFSSRMGKIKQTAPGKYIMVIHSNLWYEFEGSHEA